ncbi:MAG: SRPBCC family protein [Actinomycetota bacterium]|nr:SRPBCC family protein [Actinomycetota bacterium]MDD5667502.1 SRPBCC family protein [Actinomycetota bacterium]
MTDVYVSAHTVSVHIGRPPPEVFDFITTCSSWPRWHPATVSVAGAVDHPAREGEVIVEKVRHGILRDTFPWEVMECRPPERWQIRGKSKRYGQKVKITYALNPRDGGTLWEREMRFYLPGWFALLDRLFFAAMLRRNSETAVRQLKELLESP